MVNIYRVQDIPEHDDVGLRVGLVVRARTSPARLAQAGDALSRDAAHLDTFVSTVFRYRST